MHQARVKRIKSDCYRCVLQCAIFACMTRCDAKPLRVVRSACAETCAKRANVCAHATKTQCRPASACARVWQHVGTTRTHRTPKQKTHAPHRKQTRHTATRYANATPCTHELDSAAHGVATRENPKRKSNKTAAARCVQRCCCAVRVVRYRLRGHEAFTGELVRNLEILQDQLFSRLNERRALSMSLKSFHF